MATCRRCGRRFNVSSAMSKIDGWHESGTYDSQYPNHDVCADCADDELGAAMGTASELMGLMGDSWDDD